MEQPAVYVVHNERDLVSPDLLLLARSQNAVVKYCIATYGGSRKDWTVKAVHFSLDETEVVEVGRTQL